MKGEFGRGLVTFGWKLGEELKGQTLNKYFQFYKMQFDMLLTHTTLGIS